MANTYTQIHIQLVFAVQHRYNLITPELKEPLNKYITGIIKNNGHKLLIINGMPDHIHILLGLRPIQSISNLVKAIKQDSSKWINSTQDRRYKFAWQAGYGAFSYAKNDVPRVTEYIKNQEAHHKKRTFKDEYLAMLKAHSVEFDEKNLFYFQKE